MNTKPYLHIAIVLVALFHSLTTGFAIETPVLPVWLKGHGDLLPVVSADTVEKMRGLFTIIHANDGGDRQSSNDEYLKEKEAFDMMLDLGDDANKALLWIYALRYPEGIEKDPAAFHAARHLERGLSSELTRNASLSPIVLPLMRLRMDWVQDHLKDASTDMIWFASSECYFIENYMYYYGTEADRIRIFALKRAIRDSGTEVSKMVRGPFDFTSDTEEQKENLEQGKRRNAEYVRMLSYSRAERAKKKAKEQAEKATTK